MQDSLQLFNSHDAARILGANVSTIKRWTEEGKLSCIRSSGGHRKFTLEHLADFVQANEKKLSRLTLFPLISTSEAHLVPHILRGDFSTLVEYTIGQALLCDRARILQVLKGLYLARFPLWRIYDNLVTPVLHRIGSLWENRSISVAQEHLSSQAIKDSIIRLQGLINLPPTSGTRAICLNLSDEMHDIALKMVDHVLEARGFQVLFSGQMTPYIEIGKVFSLFRPERVYVSSTVVRDVASTQMEFDNLCKEAHDTGARIYPGGTGFKLIECQNAACHRILNSYEEVSTE